MDNLLYGRVCAKMPAVTPQLHEDIENEIRIARRRALTVWDAVQRSMQTRQPSRWTAPSACLRQQRAPVSIFTGVIGWQQVASRRPPYEKITTVHDEQCWNRGAGLPGQTQVKFRWPLHRFTWLAKTDVLLVFDCRCSHFWTAAQECCCCCCYNISRPTHG